MISSGYIGFLARFCGLDDKFCINGRRLPFVDAGAIQVVERHIGWNRWPAKAIKGWSKVATIPVRVIVWIWIPICVIVMSWLIWILSTTLLWLAEYGVEWSTQWPPRTSRASTAWLRDL